MIHQSRLQLIMIISALALLLLFGLLLVFSIDKAHHVDYDVPCPAPTTWMDNTFPTSSEIASDDQHEQQVQAPELVDNAVNQALLKAQSEIRSLRADLDLARRSLQQMETDAKYHIQHLKTEVQQCAKTLVRQQKIYVAAQQQFRQQKQQSMMRLFYDLGQLNVDFIQHKARIILSEPEFQFLSGQADIPPDHPQLLQIAALLQRYPWLNLHIRGHTDSIGSAESNRDLSQRRALAIRDALIALDINEARFKTVTGIGETEPIADNETETGRTQNRRVELYFDLNPVSLKHN
jgi:outer membrane protein OmpA-like peptidoglycan-associated protein